MFQEKIIRLRESAGTTVSVLFAGDFCPREANGEFVAAHAGEICAPVKECFDSADIRVLQWETTLTRGGAPIVKGGPNLRCTPGAVAFGKALNIDIALCANNHFGDYGPEAAMETIRHLHAAGIRTVGAGKDSKEAAKPLLFERNGIRFSLLNVAEHEFGIAGPGTPGAAGMDPLENAETAAEEKDRVVLIALHGGHETYALPSPRMQRLFRHLVHAGAAAVWNCHTHCPSGYEFFERGAISFSPGNFYFPGNQPETPEPWHTGHLVKFYCDLDGVHAMGLIPYRFTREQVVPLNAKESEMYFRHLDSLNQVIADPEKLQYFFEAWCRHGASILGNFNMVREKKWQPDNWNEPERIRNWVDIRNLFSCESHHDLVRQCGYLILEGRMEKAAARWPELDALQKIGLEG